MIAADGGKSYTGPALRTKYKNIVEQGLQPDVPGTIPFAGGGGEAAGTAQQGMGGLEEDFSIDEMDRELMGDGGVDEELDEELDLDEGEEDGVPAEDDDEDEDEDASELID
jgi:hypothetical protein